jgi:two-component system, sensor histidine kinase LadS
MKAVATIIIVASLQLLLAAASSAGENDSFRVSYWVDEARSASLREAQYAEYTELEGSIGFGYSPHALWIRLSISGSSVIGDLAVVVKPAFLRRVELYDPAINGMTAHPMLSGRDAAIEAGNHVGLDNGFIIPSSTSDRDVYLRITTTTSLTADVGVFPVRQAQNSANISAGSLALYFSFILGFCLWSLVAWAIRRDGLYGLFSLRQIYSLAHVFVHFGSFRYFLSGSLSAETRDMIYVFVTATVPVAAGYFDVRLISEFRPSRWLIRLMYLILCLPVISILLLASSRPQPALQWIQLVVACQMIVIAALALTTKADPDRQLDNLAVWTVRGGYLAFATVIFVPILMYANLIHTSVPIFKILFLHAVISTIVLFAILTIRSRQRDLIAQETRLLIQVREAELRQETSKRVEKERFLSMLTHELRNPLTVIELLPGTDPSNTAALRKAARDMAEVIDRVEQSERIDNGQIQVEKTLFDLSDLVRQLTEVHAARERLAVECIPGQVVISDAGLMRRIVENLLDNAAKYSSSGSGIRVTLLPMAENGVDGLQLNVANEIGKAGPPDATRLFTKYYRSMGAHRQPGSGLGLFLAASWVSALGGTIAYTQEDAPNGTLLANFSVWVPR